MTWHGNEESVYVYTTMYTHTHILYTQSILWYWLLLWSSPIHIYPQIIIFLVIVSHCVAWSTDRLHSLYCTNDVFNRLYMYIYLLFRDWPNKKAKKRNTKELINQTLYTRLPLALAFFIVVVSFDNKKKTIGCYWAWVNGKWSKSI